MPGYAFTVCTGCYRGNWDGWAPAYEDAILAHLAGRGVDEPARNSSGWLPRDWPGA